MIVVTKFATTHTSATLNIALKKGNIGVTSIKQ